MQNRKPFNLERALAGDPVVTRGGDNVLELYYFRTINTIVGTFDGLIKTFKIDGKYGRVEPHDWDLFMAPKTTTYYQNVYLSTPGGLITGCIKKTENEAKEEISFSLGKYIKTISFDIDEEEPKKEKKKLWIGIMKTNKFSPITMNTFYPTSCGYEDRDVLIRQIRDNNLDEYDFKITQIEVEV